MQNEIIFLTHIFVILGATLGAFLMDRHVLRALVCFYVVLANLFVSKQMLLGGLVACGGGMYIVGGMCGLLLAQTVWGEQFARRTLYASFALSILFFFLCWFHLSYVPAQFDVMHPFFSTVLGRVPRITLASLVAHVLSQGVTLVLQASLLRMTRNHGMFIVNVAAMLVGQVLDSAIFFTGSFYGDTALSAIAQMVLVSVGLKTTMVIASSLLVTWAQKYRDARDVE